MRKTIPTIVQYLFVCICFFNAHAVLAEDTLSDHLTTEYVCEVTDEKKLYDDIFLVSVIKGGHSQIHYQRRHSCNPEDVFSDPLPVRGCQRAVSEMPTADGRSTIRITCERDGQHGMADINPTDGTGSMYFYYPKLGYPERTDIQLQCFEN